MKWYSKYYKIHGISPDAVSDEIYSAIRENIKNKFSSQNPVVSLVIIAYNEETNIPACLWSLSEMVSKYPMEIIGVNNNSKDRTADVFERCGIKSIMQDEYQTPGASRQCGLDHAKGQYYFSLDADMIYPPTYVDGMMEVLQEPGVVGVSGKYSYMPDKDHSAVSLWFYEFVRDMHLSRLAKKSPELVARGAVFAHDVPLARKVGYRMNLHRGSDGSMALALLQYGKIKFVNTKECTAAIGCSHFKQQSTFSSLFARINMHFDSVLGYFSSIKHKDDPNNLAQKKENK